MTHKKMNEKLTMNETYMGAKGAIMESYKKQTAAEQAGFFQVSAHIYSWIGPSNYVAYSFAMSVTDYLEECGLLKHSVKRMANNISKVYSSNWEKALARTERGANNEINEGNQRMLWINLCEQIYQSLEPHIDTLYWSVNSLLKKENVEGDVQLYAMLFTTHILFDLAVQRYKAFFSVMGEKFANGHNFEESFPEFDPSAMHSWWSKIEDVLIPQNITPHFNDDKNTKNSFEIISAKFNDPEIINNAAIKALNYDPVFAEKSKKVQENWLNEQQKILNGNK